MSGGAPTSASTSAPTSALVGWKRFAPWVDRRGRFHRLRAAVFAVLLLPALWLVWRAVAQQLGPDPNNTAIHSTGFWAVWFLVASLAVTPAKAVFNLPGVVVVRRMVGNAALFYALAHLVLYCMDQRFAWLTIGTEIVKRFYLTVGTVGLLGLVVLGVTSTDNTIRRLGKTWKRLHRVAYLITALALLHYTLQLKLNVGPAMLATGVFAGFMLWRLLPAGPDRDWPAMLALALAAYAATLAVEYAWYRFGTRVDPAKVIRGEFDISFGLGPADLVLATLLLVAAATELRRVAATPFGATLAFTMGIFALGAFAGDAASFALGWLPDDDAALSPLVVDTLWAALLATLGAARWLLRHHRYHILLDWLWLLVVLDQVAGYGLYRLPAVMAVAAAGVATALLLSLRLRGDAAALS